MKAEFFYRFKKNTQISDFTKIHTMEAKLFHVDRQAYKQT